MSLHRRVVIVPLLLTIVLSPTSRGLSCEKRCCQGQNESCFHQEPKTGLKCFCDAFCSKSKDCCSDYDQFCGRRKDIHCIVSNWTPWTQCSRKCGMGFQSRVRRVLRAPENNGKKCGHQKEDQKCFSIICPIQNRVSRKRNTQHSKILSTVARLLPNTGKEAEIYKKYSPKHDIRHHLHLNHLYQNNLTEPKDEPYCGFYRIRNSFGTCSNFEKIKKIDRASWSQHFLYLVPNQKICATCYSQQKQQNLSNQCLGTGVLHKISKWRAIRSDNCYGYFKLLQKKRNCVCPGKSFILI